jgi:hypothetical protein
MQMSNHVTNLIVYITSRHPTIFPTATIAVANFSATRACPLGIEISFRHIFSIPIIQLVQNDCYLNWQ